MIPEFKRSCGSCGYALHDGRCVECFYCKAQDIHDEGCPFITRAFPVDQEEVGLACVRCMKEFDRSESFFIIEEPQIDGVVLEVIVCMDCKVRKELLDV